MHRSSAAACTCMCIMYMNMMCLISSKKADADDCTIVTPSLKHLNMTSTPPSVPPLFQRSRSRSRSMYDGSQSSEIFIVSLCIAILTAAGHHAQSNECDHSCTSQLRFSSRSYIVLLSTRPGQWPGSWASSHSCAAPWGCPSSRNAISDILWRFAYIPCITTSTMRSVATQVKSSDVHAHVTKPNL